MRWPRYGSTASRLIVDVTGRVQEGLLLGLLMATGLSLWAGLIALLRRSTWLPQAGTTVWRIVAGYYTAALIGGVAYGALKPLTRRRIGVFVVGWVVGSIAYFCVALYTPGARGTPIWVYVVPGLVMGGVALVIRDNRPQSEVRWNVVGPLLLVAVVLGLILFTLYWL